MPDANEKLEFRDYDKQYKNEIVIFYDLECILKNSQCSKCISICKCIEDDTNKFTETKQIHVPCIYSYAVIDCDGHILEQKTKYCPKGMSFLYIIKNSLVKYLL